MGRDGFFDLKAARASGRAAAKARAATGQAANPTPQPKAARVQRALARFEDHWLADLIGAVSLFVGLWLGLLLGHAWGL